MRRRCAGRERGCRRQRGNWCTEYKPLGQKQQEKPYQHREEPSPHYLLYHTKVHQANGKNHTALEELSVCIPELQFDFHIHHC